LRHMTHVDITHQRLLNQHIAQADLQTPAEVVRSLVAMQAQDYAGALWSVALRTPAATQTDVEQAIADKAIIRTWPMRGTLHFVAPEDIRWLLKLLGPRIIRSAAGRDRNLGLDDKVYARARKLVVAALEGGKVLTRNQLYDILTKGGVEPAGQRGIHILARFSQERLLCFGPHQEKQPTFVLLEEWVAPAQDLTEDEALAELAKRYFTSHGPATENDLARWAGLSLGGVRRGLEMVRSELAHELVDGQTYWMAPGTPVSPANNAQVYLLPGFDEYILGYKDRSLMLELEHSPKIVPGNNGMFMPTIVADGQVVGLWRRTIKKNHVAVVLQPFTTLTAAQLRAAAVQAKRYEAFLGKPVIVE
jgi:hypothetical protein